MLPALIQHHILLLVCCYSRFPSAPLMAAGYSLGSVLLTKYVAEADVGLFGAGGSGLVAAVLVSPPVCIHSTNSRLSKPTSFEFVYNLAVAYK